MEPLALHKQQTFIRHKIQSCWYAIYTRPRHEKKVFYQIQKEGIDAYLPLRTTLKQWSDRKKKVSEPFFSCYLFVNVTSRDYYSVLNVPGVVRYVSFEGKPVVIPERQIKLIRDLLIQDFDMIEYTESIPAGTRVKIVAGPLSEVKGTLIDHAGKKRVIIRIEEIDKSLLINVPSNILQAIE